MPNQLELVASWLRDKYMTIYPELDERGRRRWAAMEARSLGWGGVAAVALATGLSDRTVRNGIQEIGAVSRAPIPDVRVDQAFTHYLGIKRMTREESALGTTDSRGAFSVGGRDMYSKSYSIGFYKEGYDRAVLLLYVVKGEGSEYQIVWPEKVRVAMGKTTDFTKLVIPMRRK